MRDFETIAREMADAFTTKQRDSGERYTVTRDGTPDWIRDACQHAHGSMLPDDYRYQMIASAAEHLADNGDDDDGGEWADAEVSVYHRARADWYASHGDRSGYCDEARRDGLTGDDADISDQMAAGWYLEALEVYGLVLEAIREQVEAEEDE